MGSLVYVTGVPGAGKSTVRAELRRRGLAAIGVDEDRIGAFHTADGIVVADGDVLDDPGWRARHVWRIVPERLDGIERTVGDRTLYLCGSAANEGDLWPRFTSVVALDVDDRTLRHRLATRTANNFGKSPDELSLALGWNRTYATDMRRYGAVVLDATRPIGEIVDELLERTQPLAVRSSVTPGRAQRPSRERRTDEHGDSDERITDEPVRHDGTDDEQHRHHGRDDGEIPPVRSKPPPHRRSCSHSDGVRPLRAVRPSSWCRGGSGPCRCCRP